MKKILLIGSLVISIALVVTAITAFLWYQNQLQPVDPSNTQKEVVVIPPGSLTQVANELHQKGYIHSPFAFKLLARQLNIEKEIQAGTFRLSPAMPARQIMMELTQGTLDLWVTLLEGWRREEMAATIEAAYEEHGHPFDQTAFLNATEGEEGFLFPDTYLFPIDANETQVASILRNTFDQKIEPLQEDINQSTYTLNQIITMASLIEREANVDKARRLVSGILWKRYENDWPLQVDATLQYALGYNESRDSWWVPPTPADKEVNSPYNTYQNTGLPPGPISNPSLASIQAALNPTQSDYWYYLTGNDGNMYYAETIEQHNQNIRVHLR